ncbi:MAG TPA: hypothetical protein VIS95_03795 [Solirubrobacterales bacterium]
MRGASTRTRRAALIPALALLALLALVPAASADFVIGSQGSGAGQYEDPRGLGVDTSNGRVYLGDANNNRIDVFEASGEFLFAFGWGVRDGSTAAPQTCGPAATPPSVACFKGIGGSGAGQILRPEQVAVDSASHSVYVSETENHRVQKFDADGGFEWMVGGEVDQVTKANLCTLPANCGAGEESEVESEPGVKTFPAREGFFFSTLGRGLPLAVGPGGVLYVADSRKLGSAESEGFNTRIQRFNPDGTLLGPQMLLPETVGRVQSLAVDPAGDFYIAVSGSTAFEPGVRKYDPTGTLVTSWAEGGRIAGSNTFAIALEPSNNLFVGTKEDLIRNVLRKYDLTGTQIKVFFSLLEAEGRVDSLAFHQDASGDLLAINNGKLLRVTQPPPGPLLVPGTAEASPVGSVKATLRVAFNPQGKASHARFEYIDKESFEANGDEFEPVAEVTPNSPDTPADFKNHTVEATNVCAVPSEETCLEPETTYYFRPIAENADGEVKGEKAEFTTLPPILFGSIFSTEVGTDSARLHVEANPLGVGATARFQYIEEGPDYQANGFQNSKDGPTLSLGSGEEAIARSTQLLSLKPGTTYHYRVIADNPFHPEVISGERSFTTFAPPVTADTACPNQALRTGPSASLPDCRAYELVSPLDKNNGDVLTLLNTPGYPTFLDQSSVDGESFTFSSYRAFADPESAPYTNQYLATRNERGTPAEGWQSESLSPKGKGAEFLENPFKAFSPDLSHAWLSWLSRAGEAPPDSCAPSGYNQLYRRDNDAGAFAALSCSPIEQIEEFGYLPEVQGFSADGATSVFRADEALTPEASDATTVNPFPRPIYQLYLSTGSGQLRLLSVLPDGKAAAQDSSAGTVGDFNAQTYWNINRFGSLQGAVSEDGKRVFWSRSTAGSEGPLYLRINADQEQSTFNPEGKCKQPTRACTIAISEPLTPDPVRFQAGNPQGTKALFTVVNGPLSGNLYRFDADAKPAASELIAEGVIESILGASEDLSRVYFASTEASAQAQSEGAVFGEPNVYFAEGGTTRFVATLTSTPKGAVDGNNPYGEPISIAPIKRTARVSADGSALVFMSNSPELAERTAGYDNTDVRSPVPCGEQGGLCDAEVYRYEASGILACISCNPSGARPAGRRLAEGITGQPEYWGAATVPRFQSDLFQPRYLSDNGDRVFFNSFESLVLADTNGKQDVYEWQAPGSGDCSDESPTYLPVSEGCLSLISSGQSPVDSTFLDASPDGEDAFFTTLEGLLPQDYGLIDVYDARVNGGFSPPPSPPAACEGEACQGAPRVPEDATPALMAFEGSGNFKAAPTRPRCNKGKVRRRGRCVARKGKRAAKRKRAGGTGDGKGRKHARPPR